MTEERLKEIESRLQKSGGDCQCHCMQTCPDKAQDYWSYYEQDVEELIAEVRRLQNENYAFLEGSEDAQEETLRYLKENQSLRELLKEVRMFHIDPISYNLLAGRIDAALGEK